MNELYHHGIHGQKWGHRRYQNSDGSLTPEGREHYGVGKRKTIRDTEGNEVSLRKQARKMNRLSDDAGMAVSAASRAYETANYYKTKAEKQRAKGTNKGNQKAEKYEKSAKAYEKAGKDFVKEYDMTLKQLHNEASNVRKQGFDFTSYYLNYNEGYLEAYRKRANSDMSYNKQFSKLAKDIQGRRFDATMIPNSYSNAYSTNRFKIKDRNALTDKQRARMNNYVYTPKAQRVDRYVIVY